MKTKHKEKTKSAGPDPVDRSEKPKGQAPPSGEAAAARETRHAGDGTADSTDKVGNHSLELEKQRLQIEKLEDQLLRARAEQQNITKRSANELSEAVRYANASFVKSLLGTIDDFERTLEGSKSADARTVLQGVRLIYDNFMKVLQENRIEVIEALDKPFDPRCHEAVQQLPAEGREPGTVIQVLQRGFRLDDRVLRPAKVMIAAPGSKGEVKDQVQEEADAASAPTEER